MNGLNQNTTDYGSKPYEIKLETAANQTSSYRFIVVPAAYENGKYIIPQHMGERGAQPNQSIANKLIVYDVKTGKINKVDIDQTITKAEQPGLAIYKLVKENYGEHGGVILITSTKLKASEGESELEKIIIEVESAGNNAFEAIGKRTGKEFDDEEVYKVKEEKKYEKGEEEAEVKKELRGEEMPLEENPEEGESAPEGDSSPE